MVDPLTAALVAAGMATETAFGAFLITNASLIANVAFYGVTIAGSAAMQRRAKAKAKAAFNASLKDRELTFRSAVAPRRIIYGRDRVGGQLAFAQSTGDKLQYLHVVLTLAAHECDAIEEIWFGDVKLPDPDGDGWITSGPFGTAKTVRDIHTATVAGGSITLPRAATRVTDITAPSYGDVSGAMYTGTHTPGTAVVSGLPDGETLTVGYEYDEPTRKVRVRKHLGAPGQVADADLVAESGGKWTSAHKGTGICYLYLRLDYEPEMFANFSLDRVMCVVRGKKVLDDRTSTTAWTQNAQLITADWLKDQTYGMRASAGQVPAAEVIAGANICDEDIAIDDSDGTQPRYTFNGSFTTDQTPREVLEDLLSGMAGTAVWTQGRWLLRPGAYRTPEAGAEITEDHLAGGGVVVTPRASRSTLFNGVRVTYRDPDQGWAEVQAPVVTNAAYVAQDGGVSVVRNISLPGVMDSIRAQRLGKIELERARQAVTVQAGTNMRAYNYAPTDTALLMLQRYGWGSGKVFEIADRTWSHDATLAYTWRETAPEVYEWALGDATVGDPAPDTELRSPYTPPAALGDLTIDTGTAQLWRQADGTVVSRAYVQWPASVDQFVIDAGRIELQWTVGGDTQEWQTAPPMPGDATSAWLAPLPDRQVLVVRVRQINAGGARGAWSYKTVVVQGKDVAPANVSGFAGSISNGRIRWGWPRLEEADFARTEVRASDTGWGNPATPPLWSGNATDWTEPVSSVGGVTRYARHFDTSGNFSATSGSATVSATEADLIESIAALASAAYNGERQYVAVRVWNFNHSDEGWTGERATLTAGPASLTVDGTSGNPVIRSPEFALYGPGFARVRMRVMRTAGAGWIGNLYYGTVPALPGYAGHDEDGGYYKGISDTTVIGEWVVLEWDMAVLDAGANDWTTRTIKYLRFDLGSSSADDFEIDWVAIGTLAPGSYGAQFGINISGKAGTDDLEDEAATAKVIGYTESTTASWARGGIDTLTAMRRVLRQDSWTNDTGRAVLVEYACDFGGRLTSGPGSVRLWAEVGTSAAADGNFSNADTLPRMTNVTAAYGRYITTRAVEVAAGDTLYVAAVAIIGTANSTTTDMEAEEIGIKILGIKR